MEIDIESIVKEKMVSDILSKVSDEDRDIILEKAMTKVLGDVFNSYQVDRALKEDAERYMAEYIRKPEVQERIKTSVETAFDRILVGMVAAFETKIEDTLHSKYVSFKPKDV